MLTLDSAKLAARRVAQCLNTYGIALSAVQALEVVAAVHQDAPWDHWRQTLQAQEVAEGKPPLQVFTVALYRRDDTGNQQFEAKSTVLCYHAEQAQDFVFDQFWHPRYDQAGFCAEYSTQVMSLDTFPDLDMVVEWLAQLASTPYPGPVPLSEALWRALSTLGVASAQADAQYDPEVIEQALLAACADATGPAAVFDVLYAALPEGFWFMAPDEDTFGLEDDRVVFRA